jgi:hypothetical protein
MLWLTATPHLSAVGAAKSQERTLCGTDARSAAAPAAFSVTAVPPMAALAPWSVADSWIGLGSTTIPVIVTMSLTMLKGVTT